MSSWQEPLSEEKIAWLVDQFAKAKQRIEEIYGTPTKPWTRNRH